MVLLHVQFSDADTCVVRGRWCRRHPPNICIILSFALRKQLIQHSDMSSHILLNQPVEAAFYQIAKTSQPD